MKKSTVWSSRWSDAWTLNWSTYPSGSSPTLPGKLPAPASCSYFLLLLLIFLLLILSSSDIHAHTESAGKMIMVTATRVRKMYILFNFPFILCSAQFTKKISRSLSFLWNLYWQIWSRLRLSRIVMCSVIIRLMLSLYLRSPKSFSNIQWNNQTTENHNRHIDLNYGRDWQSRNPPAPVYCDPLVVLVRDQYIY